MVINKSTLLAIHRLFNSNKIKDKAVNCEIYRQHLIAGILYNTFQLNEVEDILYNTTFTFNDTESVCKIISDLSGFQTKLLSGKILPVTTKVIFSTVDEFHMYLRATVNLGCLTHEIEADLFDIGWIHKD